MKKKHNKLGNIRAITQMRKMVVDRKSAGLAFLMSRWSIETHIFVTTWGAFGLTLEDVAVLASLSILSDAHGARIALTTFLSKSKYSTNKGMYISWRSISQRAKDKTAPMD